VSLEIIPVWNQMTPELEAELAEFWIKNGAMLDANKATERAKQVVCLVRSEQGAIAGVSTAYPRIVPLLRQPMYYYRNFIAEEFRGRHLSIPFLRKSKAVLQEYSLALPQPLCIGVIIEMANKRLEAHYDQAYWHQTGFTFMGYSKDGLQLRVSYFDGVRLYPPAPLKKVAAKKKPARAASS
jgi:hypothetical protein